jgi:uncharacterized protein (TIGR03000 family)
MLRLNLTKLAVGLVVAAGASLWGAQAEAGWRHHGSWGSWGSSGGSWGSYGSWGSSGGSWGSHGGRWHRHHRVAFYSSGGSWGSSGGSWGSHGSWGSSGGSWGGYRVVVPAYSAPVEAQPAQPSNGAPAPGPAAPSRTDPATPFDFNGSTYYLPRQRDTGSAMLNVSLPAEAKVYVNGTLTKSTGATRQYVSRSLEPGQRYTYEVRAELTRDGQTLTEHKTVQLTAGEQINLVFRFEPADEQPVAKQPPVTKLTVHVPTDAKVYLAGNATRSTGALREFTTTRLADGEQWTDYTIQVVAQVDGQTVTREETITLQAGESRELTFDFASAEVARTAAK